MLDKLTVLLSRGRQDEQLIDVEGKLDFISSNRRHDLV